MRNDKLISEYMKFNKVLLSTINIDEEKINLFDGENNLVFSYEEFFFYIAKYFDLIPDFIQKAVVVIDSLDKDMELLEIDAEYRKNNGKKAQYIYNLVKINESEVLLSVKEEQKQWYDQIDQMTKANQKSYIDNRAKNNMLTKTPFVVIYADIDNFKHINDEYGHMIGDMILIEMVTAAKNFLGDKGAISRIGGDRFLIIYDIEDDYDAVHEFLFDLKMSMQRISTCSSRGISITLTYGSAQFPSDGNYELLLKKCEKALIRGKNKGRDCFVMYLEEKCGKVTLNDEISDEIVKIDSLSAKNDVYSMITNINQVLADDINFDKSIEEALSLVGSYFYVDRVSIARLNIKTGKIMKHHVWYNPMVSIKHEVYCNDEIVPCWGKALGTKMYVRVDDYKSLPKDYPLIDIFPKDQTTATMSFELIVNGRSFGIIRFDMTTGPRHWQPEDFQIFLLVSQLFASYIQKNYLKETNYKTLYLDANYGCNNFTYFFKTAAEEIIAKNIEKFTILEIEVREIINYRSIIGRKKMKELINVMIDVLNEEHDIIYGKHHSGPFVVYFRYHCRKRIGDFYKKFCDNVHEFTKANNIHDLSFQIGAYEANSTDDRLVDAVSNATLTRTLNRTTDILYYSEDVKNQALFKSEMVLRIDEALEKNEFLLYLQPKISTTTGELVGAEALTRWKYKGEKLLFPDTFIPLFEQQGVIDKLDYSVFENVCRYQRNLIDENKKVVPISVNVSRFISDFDGYIKNIEGIRKKYDIDPKYIEIEITEGMYYENSQKIFEFICKLHDVGYKVSMDDFGSGYSNLVSMAKLNFDTIKFDKSFCIDLENNNVKIMLDKLIELIKMMNMSTICEGVETKENVDYLTKIGCDSIQGYYYSKPIPYQDFKKKYYGEA